MSLRAISILYVPYMLVAVLGVLSVGTFCQNLDLFPNRPSLPNDPDVIMLIAKALFIIVLVTSLLMRSIVLKRQFFSFIGKEINWSNNVIFTMCMLYVPGIIGWSYPHISDWFSL